MAERRIGKSELIKQALKENNTKHCIYKFLDKNIPSIAEGLGDYLR